MISLDLPIQLKLSLLLREGGASMLVKNGRDRGKVFTSPKEALQVVRRLSEIGTISIALLDRDGQLIADDFRGEYVPPGWGETVLTVVR